MIASYLKKNGIPVEVWFPKPWLSQFSVHQKIDKWLSYVDQYAIFPIVAKFKLFRCRSDTLFVFSDQALGPWVPLVSKKPHVIHCHDFMALKSALGFYPENRTSFTGKLYQKLIRYGFQKGKNFISISQNTQNDLHKIGGVQPAMSVVVYNGLNYPFKKVDNNIAYHELRKASIIDDDYGCLLHVGGGQWYKNSLGLMKLYHHYCLAVSNPKPLIMVSPTPKGELAEVVDGLPVNADVRFFQNLDVTLIEALYSYADAFLFPSLAEGFGWPIVEAQACGCPVITTNEGPMNEIGGPVAVYLDRYYRSSEKAWIADGLKKLLALLELKSNERMELELQSISWAEGYGADKALGQYVKYYSDVFDSYE